MKKLCKNMKKIEKRGNIYFKKIDDNIGKMYYNNR